MLQCAGIQVLSSNKHKFNCYLRKHGERQQLERFGDGTMTTQLSEIQNKAHVSALTETFTLSMTEVQTR
jgi:hypothetical protein